MKDMYTFDGSEKAARYTYDLVNESYVSLLKRLQLDFLKGNKKFIGKFSTLVISQSHFLLSLFLLSVNGSTGMMGGNLSHEYHLPATIGDDTLVKCSSCSHAVNKEMLEESSTEKRCPECKSTDLKLTQGIEVGHTFLLGQKYSQLLGANVVMDDGAVKPMTMGCYGIGITRMIAASIEVLSNETDIRWPTPIAPYLVCIIPPKKGSKEFDRADEIVKELYGQLSQVPGLHGNILVDDRSQLTIGKRMMMAKRMGYPAVVVVGSKCLEDQVEVHLVNEGQQANIRPAEVAQHLATLAG